MTVVVVVLYLVSHKTTERGNGMTELTIRNKVVNTAKSYYGCKESDGSHKKIIDLYNSHKPLARGYSVKYNDAWCATFVSTIAIKCGLTDIIPTECGCNQMITLFKKIGAWVEDDAYVPNVGDIIFYDWNDTNNGDNTGSSDHVGIVVDVNGNSIKIIEGNVDNSVGYRHITVNGKYIRGYGVPKYETKVTKENSTHFSDVSAEEWYAASVDYCLEHGLMVGVGGGKFNPDEPVTRAQLAVVVARLHKALLYND